MKNKERYIDEILKLFFKDEKAKINWYCGRIQKEWEFAESRQGMYEKFIKWANEEYVAPVILNEFQRDLLLRTVGKYNYIVKPKGSEFIYLSLHKPYVQYKEQGLTIYWTHKDNKSKYDKNKNEYFAIPLGIEPFDCLMFDTVYEIQEIFKNCKVKKCVN